MLAWLYEYIEESISIHVVGIIFFSLSSIISQRCYFV